MRDLIIQRICDLRDNKLYNTWRLAEKQYKSEIYYLGNDEWKKLPDDQLLKVFEVAVMRAYKQM